MRLAVVKAHPLGFRALNPKTTCGIIPKDRVKGLWHYDLLGLMQDFVHQEHRG